MRTCEGPDACLAPATHRTHRTTKQGARALCEKHLALALKDEPDLKDGLTSLGSTDKLPKSQA